MFAKRSWFAFFFLIQLGFSMPMSTNPLSRWAMMAAMTEDGSFRIDRYYTASVDWARTPDGHYFSNKAPGPALVGEPVFALFDAWQTRNAPGREDRDRIRREAGSGNLRVLSFLFQIVPFFILSLLLLGHLKKAGLSQGARTVALVALLCGNTACLFLNQYFGHGCAAVCALGLYLATLKNKTGWATLWYGLGVLCDYSSALFLLPLLPLWVRGFRQSVNRRLWLGSFAAGTAVPAIAWIAYHLSCFGSPFRIANAFQNPLFVDQNATQWNIGGLFFLPRWDAVWGLTLGWSRGLLFTQPWVVFLIAVLLGVPRIRSAVFDFKHRTDLGLPLVFFTLLFLLNSSFGGWHGGSTPGPRYLSAGLVLLAPVLGWVWDRISFFAQRLTWTLVGLSVCLQIVFLSVYLGSPPPDRPLWGFYWDQLHGQHWLTPLLRLAIGLPVALALCIRTRGLLLRERP